VQAAKKNSRNKIATPNLEMVEKLQPEQKGKKQGKPKIG
jgi:hypothetical protein